MRGTGRKNGQGRKYDVLVLKVNGLGDADTVLRDLRTPVGLLNQHGAPLRGGTIVRRKKEKRDKRQSKEKKRKKESRTHPGAHGDGDGIGEHVHPLEEARARVKAKANILRVGADNERGTGGRAGSGTKRKHVGLYATVAAINFFTIAL